MDQKLVDGIMSEFDKLSHDEQVGLFLEIRTRLLTQRDGRTQLYKENAEVAHGNLEALAKGNMIILNPDQVAIKAG